MFCKEYEDIDKKSIVENVLESSVYIARTCFGLFSSPKAKAHATDLLPYVSLFILLYMIPGVGASSNGRNHTLTDEEVNEGLKKLIVLYSILFVVSSGVIHCAKKCTSAIIEEVINEKYSETLRSSKNT